MKQGQKFENSGMQLVCLAIEADGNRNTGLYFRLSDGMYITARDISKELNGTYSWTWGHYFTELETAKEDYYLRVREMLSFTE